MLDGFADIANKAEAPGLTAANVSVAVTLDIAWRAALRNDHGDALYWCQLAAEIVKLSCPADLREPGPSHVSAGSWWGLYHDTREEIADVIHALRVEKGKTTNMNTDEERGPFCPNCHGLVSELEVECAACGARLVNDSAADAMVQEKRMQSLKIIPQPDCADCQGTGIVVRAAVAPALSGSRILPAGTMLRAFSTHGALLRFELCGCLTIGVPPDPPVEVPVPSLDLSKQTERVLGKLTPKERELVKQRAEKSKKLYPSGPSSRAPLSLRHRRALEQARQVEPGKPAILGQTIAQELYVMGLVELEQGTLGTVHLTEQGRQALEDGSDG